MSKKKVKRNKKSGKMVTFYLSWESQEILKKIENKSAHVDSLIQGKK